MQTQTRTLRQALQQALDKLDDPNTPDEERLKICLEMTGRRFPVGDDFLEVNFTLDVPDPDQDRIIRLKVETSRKELISSLKSRSAMIYKIEESRERFITSSSFYWEQDDQGFQKPILFVRFPYLEPGANFHIRV